MTERNVQAATVSLLALATPAGYVYNPLSRLFSPPAFGHTAITF